MEIHRNIDRSLMPFGLEREDFVLLAAGWWLGLAFFGRVVSVVTLLAAFLWLRKIKKGKPEGYLLHWAYRRGGRLGRFPKGSITRFGP